MRGIRNASLVRESSSPAIYLVVGNIKFWITSPAEFDALGFQWSKVRVVDDGALGHLTEHRLHAPPTTRPSDVFFDCGQDFDAIGGRYRWNCQNSTSLIRREVLVAGWLYDAPYVNVDDSGVEDVHFNLHLDVTFLDRVYGPDGLSTALTAAVYPGNPPAPKPLRFADGGSVTFNSWILPGNALDFDLHGELNAWHQNTTGPLFSRHWIGRGQAPASWVNPLSEDTDAWFPFRFPPGLQQGDYLVMRGPLWQDLWHYNKPSDPRVAWDSGPTTNHAGWLEMHPIDWIMQVRGPGPNARFTTARVALCTPSVTGDPVPWSASVRPDFAPSAPTRRLEVRSYLGPNIDNRMTVAQVPFPHLTVNRLADRIDLSVTVEPSGTSQGRFKASWLVDWRELDNYDQPWVDDALPAGAQALSDGESWDWVDVDPAPFTGTVAHRSTVANGMHQHYFLAASTPMQVGIGATLFAMVYLNPDNPPDEVMLQWYSMGWLHRAYWGADRLAWGMPGTAERLPMGPLPFADEWVRLEVPAAAVGLEGKTVTGMAFSLWNGQATWDYTGTCALISSPKTTVPDVTEMSMASAENAIRAAGLEPIFEGATALDAWVWHQSPKADTTVDLGSAVTLQLRTGPTP
jgi:PASTA domain